MAAKLDAPGVKATYTYTGDYIFSTRVSFVDLNSNEFGKSFEKKYSAGKIFLTVFDEILQPPQNNLSFANFENKTCVPDSKTKFKGKLLAGKKNVFVDRRNNTVKEFMGNTCIEKKFSAWGNLLKNSGTGKSYLYDENNNCVLIKKGNQAIKMEYNVFNKVSSIKIGTKIMKFCYGADGKLLRYPLCS